MSFKGVDDCMFGNIFTNDPYILKENEFAIFCGSKKYIEMRKLLPEHLVKEVFSEEFRYLVYDGVKAHKANIEAEKMLKDFEDREDKIKIKETKLNSLQELLNFHSKENLDDRNKIKDELQSIALRYQLVEMRETAVRVREKIQNEKDVVRRAKELDERENKLYLQRSHLLREEKRIYKRKKELDEKEKEFNKKQDILEQKIKMHDFEEREKNLEDWRKELIIREQRLNDIEYKSPGINNQTNIYLNEGY